MTADDRVDVFACGQYAVATCAPFGMQREVVALRVNRSHPPRIALRRWKVAEPQSDIAYPCECEHDAKRNHWLLRC